MKKILSIIMLTVLVLSGIVLTACNNNVITSFDLSYSAGNDEISFLQKSSDPDNKTTEYDLTAQYGIQIKIDDFTVSYTVNNSENFEIKQKTDDTSGYTLESNLPTSSVPDAGKYTLKFGYEGWTDIVNVVIEKKVVRIPYLEEGNEVEYDGRDYTRRIIYDKNLATMLDTSERKLPINTYDQTRYYNVEFELKDKKNYRWSDLNTGSDNFTYSFAIDKKQMRVDVDKYIKVDTADKHFGDYNENYAAKYTLNYSLRENYPKTLEEILALPSIQIDASALSSVENFIDVKLVRYNTVEEVNEISEAGHYEIILLVKNTECYAIGTTTQTTQLLDKLLILEINISQ